MEKWLRCNKCYHPAMNSSKEFSVTQCEHVFCCACVVEARKNCPECKAVGSQSIVLQTPMPQQMLHYFSNVSTLVDRTLDAARFQRNQFMILLRHARHIDEKYEKGKKYYDQASKEMKALSATRAKLRESVEKLRAADARSAAAPASCARSSMVRREDQHKERTLVSVSMNSQSQHRDPRIFPNMSSSRCSQQTRYEPEYASTSVRPRAAETRTTRTNPSSSRASTNHREQQMKRALEYDQTSARSQSNAHEPQYRMITESSIIPVSAMSSQSHYTINHHQQQQIKRALEYNQSSVRPRPNAHPAPQHRMITESSNIPVSVISAQSHHSTNQQHQIKRALEYNQSSVRPRPNAHPAPQHRMITESSNIPMSVISSQSHHSTNQQQQIKRALAYNEPSVRHRAQHRIITTSLNIPGLPISSQSHQRDLYRESQNMRPVENAQMGVRQNHPSSQMANYRCNQNSGYNSCQYPPRAIISSDCSSWDRTPQEQIHQVAINRRVPRSIDTSSGTSHSGHSGETFRNTSNPSAHFSNYNY